MLLALWSLGKEVHGFWLPVPLSRRPLPTWLQSSSVPDPPSSSMFGLEALLKLPPEQPLVPGEPSAAALAAAAAAAEAEADKICEQLDRGLGRLFMIHGWCVSPPDAAFLDQAWADLQPLLTYLPAREDQGKIETALKVAYHAHLGQTRRSGEPFVGHPIQVAKILTELGMDADSVAAGLLHDTVEDTPLSVSDIEIVFGTVVRRLVEGETKVSKLPKRLKRGDGGAMLMGARAPGLSDEQVENLLGLLVAMAQDFRVLAIKLADRLHNMRTLMYMKPEKQVKVARETLDVYVPLARKLGVWRLKTELEDLAFRTLHADEHAALTRALEGRRDLLASLHTNRFGGQRLSMTTALTEALPTVLNTRGALKGHQVAVRLESKSACQVWARNPDLANMEEQPDLLTLKVVVSTDHDTSSTTTLDSSTGARRKERRDPKTDRALCAMVLEEIQAELHSPSSHSTQRDYISMPLDNGYQALHDQLRVPGYPFPLEVHVCTDWMDQVAQFGLLALWEERGRGGASGAPATGAAAAAAGDEAAVPLELGWLQSLSARTKRMVREEPSVTAQKLIGTLQDQLQVKRLVLTGDGEVLSLDVPVGGEGTVTVREAALAQLQQGQETEDDAALVQQGRPELEVAKASVNGQPVSLSRALRHGDVVSFVYRPKKEENAVGPTVPAAPGKESGLWIWQAPLFIYPWCLIGNADSTSYPSTTPTTAVPSTTRTADLLSNKMWGTARRKVPFGQVKVKPTETVWDSGELVWLKECELRHGRLSLGVLAYGLVHAAVWAATLASSGGAGMDLATAAAAAELLDSAGGSEEMLMAVSSAPPSMWAPWFATAFPPLSAMERFQVLSLVGLGEVLGGIWPESVAFNMRYQALRRRRRAGLGGDAAVAPDEAAALVGPQGGDDDDGASVSVGRRNGLNLQGAGGVGSLLTSWAIPVSWLREQELVLGRAGMVTLTILMLLGAAAL